MSAMFPTRDEQWAAECRRLGLPDGLPAPPPRDPYAPQVIRGTAPIEPPPPYDWEDESAGMWLPITHCTDRPEPWQVRAMWCFVAAVVAFVVLGVAGR
jgi:hypothetical protein